MKPYLYLYQLTALFISCGPSGGNSSINLPWSNGQVKGQVNKLKLNKRTMYGRANFDFLHKQVLVASLHGSCG
jgi:hypothetical protein